MTRSPIIRQSACHGTPTDPARGSPASSILAPRLASIDRSHVRVFAHRAEVRPEDGIRPAAGVSLGPWEKP